MKLEDKTIFVTDGSRGIGRALAAEFVRRGNRVVVCGRDPGKLAQVSTAARLCTGAAAF